MLRTLGPRPKFAVLRKDQVREGGDSSGRHDGACLLLLSAGAFSSQLFYNDFATEVR